MFISSQCSAAFLLFVFSLGTMYSFPFSFFVIAGPQF
uniref:Uncharacterized protein n=1 Tax=Arundo donax TaxID=35708 RepID=A0A0A9CK00_ARUDO